MIVLAVNTATSVLSVVLNKDGETLFFYSTPETRDQGNLLLRHIRQGLDENKLDYADLDLLAVVTGPGSFTGIRIGLAAMRGIALAAAKPIVGFSSFELFGHAPSKDKTNIVAVESWREELYFRCGTAEPVNLSPQDFAATLDTNADYYLTGDAAHKLAPFVPRAVVAKEMADARHLAALAQQAQVTGEKPVPYYLRPADITLSNTVHRKLGQESNG